ncbi:MAG: DUF6644 family protein [Hyphomicrobium sp.]
MATPAADIADAAGEPIVDAVAAVAAHPIFEAIAQSALAVFLRESQWLYPALETAHVLGIGLLFGPIVLFDLRVLGYNRDIAIGRMATLLLRSVWIGFAINALSGALLFISDAAEFSTNTALRVKMLLIALAGLNAAIFQARFARWQRDGAATEAPPAARASALLSLTLWVSIIIAGRMIAYIK